MGGLGVHVTVSLCLFHSLYELSIIDKHCNKTTVNHKLQSVCS